MFFKLTMTDWNMQVTFCLKVSVYSWGYGIWVSSTSFQKSNIGQPQRHPTENSTWVLMILSFFFSKHQTKILLAALRLLNSRTRMPLKSSILIFQALETNILQWYTVFSFVTYSSCENQNFLVFPSEAICTFLCSTIKLELFAFSSQVLPTTKSTGFDLAKIFYRHS